METLRATPDPADSPEKVLERHGEQNMVQAALKAVPLGQNAGQRILGRLADAIPEAVDDALRRRAAERQAFTPMLAILSSQHEHQYSRLFRS